MYVLKTVYNCSHTAQMVSIGGQGEAKMDKLGALLLDPAVGSAPDPSLHCMLAKVLPLANPGTIQSQN